MKEECEEQAELAAWVNKEERIVTFRETEGYKQAATAAFYREVSGTERIITPNDAPYEPSAGGSV